MARTHDSSSVGGGEGSRGRRVVDPRGGLAPREALGGGGSREDRVRACVLSRERNEDDDDEAVAVAEERDIYTRPRPESPPKFHTPLLRATAAARPAAAPRGPTTAPPKLTRQRKLRHVDVGSVDVEPGDLGIDDDVSDRSSSSSSPPQQRGRSSASEAIGIAVGTPISRSASSWEGGAQPPRSASSPVLHPLPLPSPRLPDPLGIADGWGDRTTLAARNIKGANLLVDVQGVVKLADFGMAKHLSTAAPNLSLKGTPYWMAPEMVQATLLKDVGYDLAVDIWSLGCTIIEMFDGKPPWSDLEGAYDICPIVISGSLTNQNYWCFWKHRSST
ncbi:uncharacterized protein [Miscanthus floridulus]|uniref:uncharacterized protein n=1 Tax=Miscanthus floridulus TaxID=154761 RepID=UPI00345ABFA2